MILVIGEALIDMIEDRAELGSFKAIVGGANANVAIALARRGTKHQFLGRLSKDRFGQIIRKKLTDNHVAFDYSIDATEQTTLVTVSIDAVGKPSYTFYVEGTADWNWTPAELPSDTDLENLHATAIQFGCLTMAIEPGNLVIEDWAREHFKQNSVTISHDINIRPALGFEANHERARVERLNEISHLIKASDEDIEWLYGLQPGASVDEIVWQWIGQTGRQVFVTRGGDGVSIYRIDSSGNRSKLAVAAQKIEVVDTVGAGDTFCANLIGQLSDLEALGADPFDRLQNLSDETLMEITRVASVAAAIACQRAGAEPPTLADLQAALATIP